MYIGREMITTAQALREQEKGRERKWRPQSGARAHVKIAESPAGLLFRGREPPTDATVRWELEVPEKTREKWRRGAHVKIAESPAGLHI